MDLWGWHGEDAAWHLYVYVPLQLYLQFVQTRSVFVPITLGTFCLSKCRQICTKLRANLQSSPGKVTIPNGIAGRAGIEPVPLSTRLQL